MCRLPLSYFFHCIIMLHYSCATCSSCIMFAVKVSVEIKLEEKKRYVIHVTYNACDGPKYPEASRV